MSHKTLVISALAVVLLVAIAGISLADARGDDTGVPADDTTVTDAPAAVASPAPQPLQAAPAATTYDAGEAGTVTVARDGGVLTIVSLSTAQGWQSHVDRAQGREVEVDFTMGAREIDFNAELEDGRVRVRVRDEVDDGGRGRDDDRDDRRDDDHRGRGRGRGSDD